MADYQLSSHALEMAEERGITREIIDDVIRNPQQIVSGNELGTLVCQSRIFFGAKEFLVRVVVGTDSDTVVVSTVYKTSRIFTYWRPDS